LFAFDVFSKGYSLSEVIIAFLAHLIPVFVLAILLFIAWKFELAGEVGYFILGIVFTVFFKTYEDFIWFTLISGPVFLIGALFLANYYSKD